jgi:hypothetical protein
VTDGKSIDRSKHPVYRNAVIAKPVAESGPNYQLHPDWQSGNVVTSGIADEVQNLGTTISPCFAMHQANAAVQAARALDPNDNGVDRRSVILPGGKSDEQAIREIYEAADYAVQHPIILGGQSLYHTEESQD